MSLSSADGGRMRRVLIALFDAATLGTMSQEQLPAGSGYLAFLAIALFMIGAAALPGVTRWQTKEATELQPFTGRSTDV